MGIRGPADTKHLHAALAFLNKPTPKWKDIIKDSVLGYYSPQPIYLETILERAREKEKARERERDRRREGERG